ncbi:TRAP-T family transporter, DctQ (4 TMs) subunit [Pseudooceanicola batsensis HTCC2597]|uniref:TRAP transporter small permease protein n=1 Tax=Pseudooceanicola batsensis (strain ATCC BAA-863 / DSM 15984 / KCTC 12145 / HTCC2597) TaxID=252305 RepID=A3TSQ4_PSEBH|nr:TRAP transporter small permease [Pseudooceanicola batsensis]EAQ04681.1 TRAP-T family transporter, DctQ (4 TMs) subunit [Pseudooceanicola batsensis HTCC2597]
MKTLSFILSRAARWSSALAGLAVALMMLQVTLSVALRHLFGHPLPATLTLVSYYYMVIAAFIPLALAEERRAHISVEFVTDLLPQRVQRHVAGVMLLPTAAVTGLLTWRTFGAAMDAFRGGTAQVSGSSTIPVWPAYFALPAGAGLMTALLVLRFATYVTGDDGRELPQ